VRVKILITIELKGGSSSVWEWKNAARQMGWDNQLVNSVLQADKPRNQPACLLLFAFGLELFSKLIEFASLPACWVLSLSRFRDPQICQAEGHKQTRF